ncbi:ArsC/Spx/MgsR family protein [Methylocella sp.]|uniref:ArsC/Spx/MgsR family protein n=1 Tax=Methylocella sp. TaxID=1978226 RepID=UPI0037845FC8
MTQVVFYEKPGCANNARQKRLLAEAGHRLDVRDLLAEPWTAARLRAFFGARPVAEWFNAAAPRVKSGEIDPAALDAEAALALMLAEPLLIRRPLMEAEGRRAAGFDPAFVDRWIGLSPQAPQGDLESCRGAPAAGACKTPAAS